MNIEELKKVYNINVDILEKYTRIQVSGIENNRFYQELVECIKGCNENVSIADNVIGNSTKKDFLQGEDIIQNVIKNVNPDWTKKQIAAYVHYKMGKIISYFPDFNFASNYLESSNNTRNIWSSLANRNSVCNGIVLISRNILSRLGVSTEELSSGKHSFLLVETEEGNIITDPTWDLKNTLYGARPIYFGKTYEQLREEEGISKAHKLENIPQNVLEISEEQLREIYYSIGYTKEDRKFLFPILDKVTEINSNKYANMKEKVNAFFTMFT